MRYSCLHPEVARGVPMRRRLAATAVGVLLLSHFACARQDDRTPNPSANLSQREQSGPPCRIDTLLKRSFVGTYQGRTIVLYIEHIDDRPEGLAFLYSATLDGQDRVAGKGTLDPSSCEAILSTFDSKARLIAKAGGWSIESVEPSWRLVSSGGGTTE